MPFKSHAVRSVATAGPTAYEALKPMNEDAIEATNVASASRLLVAAWVMWLISVVALPLTTYLVAWLVQPSADDEYGLGPFLGGAFLGGLLAVVTGIVALVLGTKMRRARPLPRRALRVLERLIWISPAIAVFSIMTGLWGSSWLVAAEVYAVAAVMVVVLVR